jgi:hypothetical protein
VNSRREGCALQTKKRIASMGHTLREWRQWVLHNKLRFVGVR